MRILLIDVNCKQNSTGKIVYDLYGELNDKGHIASVCYGRGPLIKEPNIHKFSSNIETYAHAFLTRVTGLTGIYSPIATRKLIKIIDEFKPDVVHIHELHAYFVNIAPLMTYLKKNNIRTIWTFHCEFMYTGKCGHALSCEKWKKECGDCPQLKEYPSSLFFDFTRKMFNMKKRLFADWDNLVITTPSKWLADRVRQSFLYNKDIQVIYNGIDTKNIFYPRRFEHLKEKHNLTNEKIILAVAPNLMSKSKGGHFIVELAQKLRFENVKFILIGIDDLKQNFDDNIIALGKTSNQIKLAEYYSMADLLVLTSEKETFSLVCVESLACGTPILGFESGAPSEIATRGYGIFVEYGDVDSLAVIVKEILHGEKIFRSRGECAKYAKDNYAKEVMTGKFLNVYINNKVAEKHSG